MIFRYSQNQSTSNLSISAIAAGENYIGHIGGTTRVVSGEFNRPANTDAYVANDVVNDGNDDIAIPDAARVGAGTGYITRIHLATNKASITPRFRIHFSATNNFFTNKTDGVQIAIPYTDIADDAYIGYYDMPAMVSTGANGMSYAFDSTMRLPFDLTGKGASTTIYYLIETLDPFTPDSGQSFRVAVGVEQN